jgi:hypothetical protein
VYVYVYASGGMVPAKHRQNFVAWDEEIVVGCDACAHELLQSGEWIMNEEEGVIKKSRRIDRDRF